MLVVWAANPFSSLLTLERKSRPPDKPSRWLLTLSLRTSFPWWLEWLMADCDCCCWISCCCWASGGSASVTELRDPSEPNEPNERNPTGRLLDDSRELPSACVINHSLYPVRYSSLIPLHYLEQSAFGSSVFSALGEISDGIFTNGRNVFRSFF